MGKFIVKQAKTGFMFDLKARNGEIIATSQIYTTKESCKEGIESVKHNAPIAPVENQTVENFEELSFPKFEVYTDKAGQFRFRLKAKNGQIIATGEGYTTHQSANKGIESIKTNAPDAEIVEEE